VIVAVAAGKGVRVGGEGVCDAVAGRAVRVGIGWGTDEQAERPARKVNSKAIPLIV
jgi:hypothetical protein